MLLAVGLKLLAGAWGLALAVLRGACLGWTSKEFSTQKLVHRNHIFGFLRFPAKPLCLGLLVVAAVVVVRLGETSCFGTPKTIETQLIAA